MLHEVDRIFVLDGSSENDESLELRVSNKNFSYVESNHEYDQLVENKELKFRTSGGIVYLPANLPINIESENRIFGITSSIGYIYSKKNIDLLIKHDKPYNIVLDAPFDVNINNTIVQLEECHNYTKLMDYSQLWNDFDELYTSGLHIPEEITSDDFTRADFSRSKHEKVYAHELCEFSNALYLESGDIITIYDKDIKLKERAVQSKTFNKEEFIRNSLLNALIRGDLPTAKRAFRNWKYYIIYKDKLKNNFFENRKIRDLMSIFTPESFQEDNKDV